MAKQDDFSEKDNPQEGNNADDNFGLPEIEYKPLESNEVKSEGSEEQQSNEEEADSSERKYNYEPEPEPKSSAPIIIAIIIGLVVLVAGYLIYQYVIVPQSEKSKKEAFAKQEADRLRREEAARLAKEKEEAARALQAQQQEAAATPTPTVGSIETLSARTGRYYVVITSDLDDDLIMDYAKKLSAEGTSTKIIPPFGKSQFHRLAIGDFDTFANAQTSADELKAKYGSSVWVLKY